MNLIATTALTVAFSLFLSLVISTSFFPSMAEARTQRVIVFLKDQAAFTQVQNHFTKFGSQNLMTQNNLWGAAPHALSQVNGNIQTTLKSLNSVIVKIENPSEIQKLRLNPAVEFVDEEIFHPAPKPVHGFAVVNKLSRNATHITGETTGEFVPNASTPWGINAVRAVEAWPLSRQGAGARVLVLDTGIDKDHPSLKANLEKGKSFVDPYGLAYDYFDDVGHGSHVAGTIVGVADSSGFTGVAPKAKLLMGKVCTPEGCSNLSVARGIEWGIQEKVDLVSMSLGGAQATPTERRAVSKAAAAGITIVAASGNDGIPQVSYPAALPTVIAVGAVNADLLKADFSQWGPELAVVAPGVDVVSSVPQGSGRTPLVQIQLGSSPVQTIPSSFIEGSKTILEPLNKEMIDVAYGRPEDFAKVAASGKIALVKRGENKFMDKIKAGLDAKVAGLVVYNNVPGLIHGAISNDGSEIEIPIFVIELSQGEMIKASLASGNVAQTSLLVQKSNYSSFDGTSMATPHVAGVVALMKATNKQLTPAQVKAILTSTAKRLTPNTENEVGAGIVQADAAVEKATHPDVLNIPLGANLN